MAPNTDRAVLAGGCFWGMQELLRHRNGVITTRAGYAGGQNDNPTGRNHPGHAEAVEVVFDPGRTCYRDILEFFFQIHDPTTRDRQGEDVGSEYRSEIFCTNEDQRKIAEDTITNIEASGLWPGTVVTQISQAGPFWEAEAEDQGYLQRHPDGPTCHFPRPGWKLPRRYQVEGRDSTRWLGFPFRDGDIVISTPSKTGTTWVQMICALLIFGEPQLPAPLGRLSPWLDHQVAPREDVYALLTAQEHRRFIKTHTPLDGLPLDPRVTYLVTARHPLDVAVSWYHQIANFDESRWRLVTGEPEPSAPPPPQEPLRDWLLRWIADDTDPAEDLETLPGLLWHLNDAWSRRDEPNILLVHYANLSADLDGQMRWLAGQLGITIPERAWPELVQAATFANMAAQADLLVPAPGLFKSNAAFFRRGSSGAGGEILSDTEIAGYHARVKEMAPPDMLAWLHSPRPGAAA
ncbi:MAG TPA: peptide-methionine (S)-S-oxide reductase MsrA [Streptosporangiaceae bacterium]|nr:peptide-methionine (S)-S-oxide reductase MsrA [Streptosporangiaceae bacterium]